MNRLWIGAICLIAIGFTIGAASGQRVELVQVVPSSTPVPLQEVSRTDVKNSAAAKKGANWILERRIRDQSAPEKVPPMRVLVPEQEVVGEDIALEGVDIDLPSKEEDEEAIANNRAEQLGMTRVEGEPLHQIDQPVSLPGFVDPQEKHIKSDKATKRAEQTLSELLQEQERERREEVDPMNLLDVADAIIDSNAPEEAPEPEVQVKFALREITILREAARAAGGDLEVVIRPVGVNSSDLVPHLIKSGGFVLKQGKTTNEFLVTSRRIPKIGSNKTELARIRKALLEQLAAVDNAMETGRPK